jgi:GT2 family glycosyltransferase
MFRREVFDACGYLDEEFGIGFGDDDWFCWVVQNNGYRLALVTDIVIPHHHRSTFKEMYQKETIQEMQNRAMSIYKKKVAEKTPPKSRIVADRTNRTNRTRRGRTNIRVRRP